jgi:cellulose synthase/poly-beta-1,6-N-acetylglucosamine synthase-like glycosyltransferase
MSSDDVGQWQSCLPQVSIIIPIHNSAHTIGQLLDSIQQLDYPSDRYEVLVVDNNSTDDLEGVVTAYPVRLLHERAVQSSYAARNQGIRQAKGEILAFTDADCQVHPQWLRHLQSAFRDPAIGGAAGTIKGVEPARSWIEGVLNYRSHMSSIERSRSSNSSGLKLKRSFKRPTRRLPKLLKKLGLVTYPYNAKLPSLPVAPTANVAYRQKVFSNVGLFDATCFGGGDTEFAIRMQQQSDMKLVAAPEAIVYHRHRATLRQLYKVYSRYHTSYIVHLDRYLGLDDDLRRQILIESLAYLTIGIPWSCTKLVLRTLRTVLLGAPRPFYTREMIVDLVSSISACRARIRASNLLWQGHREELWI